MAEPTGEIIARPTIARACGCLQEFQHYAVDKYRAQRRAKFQKTRCAACVAKLVQAERLAAEAIPKKAEALGALPPWDSDYFEPGTGRRLVRDVDR
jgi:hypothetical protein